MAKKPENGESEAKKPEENGESVAEAKKPGSGESVDVELGETEKKPGNPRSFPAPYLCPLLSCSCLLTLVFLWGLGASSLFNLVQVSVKICYWGWIKVKDGLLRQANQIRVASVGALVGSQ